MNRDPEHHDNRYEDGVVFTGTVEDYEDWLPDEEGRESMSMRIPATGIRPGTIIVGTGEVVAIDPNLDGFVEAVFKDGRVRLYRLHDHVLVEPGTPGPWDDFPAAVGLGEPHEYAGLV